MPAYGGVWDAPGVAAFLDEAVVPVRLACRTPKDRLWMVSLWFVRDGDALCCATARSADVVAYLSADPGVAFEVSTNDPPYRGVRGNGTASVAPDEEKATLRTLLERYLGGTDGSLARRLLDPDREEVRIRIDPDNVYSWDFSDRMVEDAATAGGETGDPAEGGSGDDDGGDPAGGDGDGGDPTEGAG